MKNTKKPKMTRVPRFQGVYYRESESRRVRGYPDKCFYFTYRLPEGKFMWEKAGWMSEGFTAAFASNKRSERLQTIRNGEPILKRKKNPTFEEVWKYYDQWQKTTKQRPRDDRSRYRRHLHSRFGNTRLSDITPLKLEKMKTELLKQGFAPATVKHCLVLVRQMYNKAIIWDLYNGQNPIKRVTMPKVNNQRERFLSVAESKELLTVLAESSPQLHDIALLSLHTGMRASEIFQLKWGHVDFENEIILVADSKPGPSRKVHMTEAVREMLYAKEKGEREDLVFTSRKGEEIKEVSNSFSKVVNKLGFNNGVTDLRQKVCFHTLRHTFASWMALKGIHILTIKELLGHSTLAMTERYSHLIPDQKRQAIKTLENVFEREHEKSRKQTI